MFLQDNPNEDDSQVVEKILGTRVKGKPHVKKEEEAEEGDVWEYYVKYKNLYVLIVALFLLCVWQRSSFVDGAMKR